jgi:hypothetical protein
MDYTFILFVIAIVCSFWSRSALQKGEHVKAKRLAWASFCCTSLLATLYAAITVLALTVGAFGPLAMNAFMAALWGFFAYRDYQFLQMLRSQ